MNENPFAPKGRPEPANREATSVGANPFAPKGRPEERIAPSSGAANREATSVGANISRLMDGEVEDVEFERCVAELKSPEAMRTWACYHVIGDHLRGSYAMSSAFSLRISQALAAEPTVLAPPPKRVAQPATFAWAVAATLAAVTVVGWTAFSMIEVPPTAVARAREAATVRAAQVKPTGDVPAEYLLAHQEYSPAFSIQGGGPYLRAATATAAVPPPPPASTEPAPK